MLARILFEDPHPHAGVRNEFMKGLAVALTGRNPKRSLWFNLGRTATGKSTLIKSLGHTYGGYVDILAAENLAIAKFSGTNDHCGWKLKFRNSRIVLTSECSTNIKLDGNLLKGVSGGDPLAVRPIGCETLTISPQATLFSFANEFPAIDPVDEAMRDRLLAVRWGVTFAKGVSRDETIGDFVKTPAACDGLFWVLNDAYLLYMKEGFLDVPEITSFTTRLTNELDEFRQIFESSFEVGGPDDLLRTDEVYQTFREWSKTESRVANKLELDFGVMKDRKRNAGLWEGSQRCFTGIKRIHDGMDDDEPTSLATNPTQPAQPIAPPTVPSTKPEKAPPPAKYARVGPHYGQF
jgi:putative DNA primase/helicase